MYCFSLIVVGLLLPNLVSYEEDCFVLSYSNTKSMFLSQQCISPILAISVPVMVTSIVPMNLCILPSKYPFDWNPVMNGSCSPVSCDFSISYDQQRYRNAFCQPCLVYQPVTCIPAQIPIPVPTLCGTSIHPFQNVK